MFGVHCPDGKTNENLFKTVVQKISNVNIDIDEKDISVCHRQGAKVDGKQPILVKFISRNKRNEVLNKKKELRNNGCSVQEDLTALRAKLLKMMINSDYVDSVRVSNGTLYACKKHGDKFDKIGCVTNPGDLLAIGFPDIDYEYLGLVKYFVATSADIVAPDDNFHQDKVVSNNSQGHSVRAVSIVNKGCVSREGKINMPDGICRRRVNENNDLLKTDIDLNPILEDEKSTRNDNDNEATIVGTHAIKNKTIYQLNGNNDLMKTDIDLNPILEDEKSTRNDNEATIAGTHAIKNKTIYQLNGNNDLMKTDTDINPVSLEK